MRKQTFYIIWLPPSLKFNGLERKKISAYWYILNQGCSVSPIKQLALMRSTIPLKHFPDTAHRSAGETAISAETETWKFPEWQ